MKPTSTLNDASGFTLIEVMIACAIVAVLVAIAIPQYKNFLFRTSQAEAVTVLDSIHKAEMSYFSAVSHFTTQPTELGADFQAGATTRLGWFLEPFSVVSAPEGYLASVQKIYVDPFMVDTWIVKMNHALYPACPDAVPAHAIDGMTGQWLCPP